MATPQWDKVKELFNAARDLPQSERTALVRERCNGDDALVDEVAALLLAHDQLDNRLEPPMASPSSDDRGEPLIGRKIGRYTLIRVLGHGGMGTVLEAEQDVPRRRVALKIVRGGAYVDQHVLKLFKREVQALALLNHPNIAVLYDSGRTDDGRHYFVMELVDGEPLIAFARQKALSTDRRLGLFVDICESIAYAHQRGVIHRDLKPSNILINPAGFPKVLDFGLAKITDSDVATTTVTHDVGKIQGTLAYMSPEQARGSTLEIDVRSDIYSLGVLLYELLTGELPYDVRSVPLPHAVRLICDEPPRRPSSIHKALRGDLETIILKALEKDLASRYQSSFEFAEDIRRCLDRQPIIARPPSALYQIKKLVTRHRLPAAFIATLLVVLVGFASSMGLLFGQSQRNLARAVDAEQEADQRADRAEQLSKFFLDVLTNMNPSQADSFGFLVQNSIWRVSVGVPETLRALVTAKRDEVLAEQRRLGDTPGVANRLLSLGILAVARFDGPDAERLTRESVRIMRTLPDVFQGDLPLALHALGAALEDAGRPAEAMACFQEALQLECESFGENSIHAITCSLRLAHLHTLNTGDLAQAEQLLSDSYARLKQLFGSNQYRIEWALRLWGDLHLHKGDLTRALEAFQGSVEISEQSGLRLEGQVLARAGWVACLILQDRAEEARSVIEQAQSPVRVVLRAGRILRENGTLEAALSLFQEALVRSTEEVDLIDARIGENELRSALYGPVLGNEPILRDLLDRRSSSFGEHDRRVHAIRMALAYLAFHRNPNSARRLFEDILETNREWPGPESLRTAEALHGLGCVLRDCGQLQEAELPLRQSLEIRESNLPPGDRSVGYARREYGVCLRALGRFEEAEQQLLAGADALETHFGPHSRQARSSFNQLARLYENWGKTERANAWLARLSRACQAATEDYQRALAGSHPRPEIENCLADARRQLIDCLIKLGRADEALPYIRQLEKPAVLLVQIGRLSLHGLRNEAAEQFFREALEKAKTTAEQVSAMLGLADVARHDHRYEVSEAIARDAMELIRRQPGENDWRAGQAARIIAHACVLQGRIAEGVLLLEEYLPSMRQEAKPAPPLNHAAGIWLTAAKHETAEPLFQEALDAATTPAERAAALHGLAKISMQYHQRFEQAEFFARESSRLFRASCGERDMRTRTAEFTLAHTLLEQGRFDDAMKVSEQRFRIDEAWFGSESAALALDFENMADIELNRGNHVTAEGHYRKALSLRESQKISDTYALACARASLGKCLVAQGRHIEAEEYLVANFALIEARRGPQSLFVKDIVKSIVLLYESRGDSQKAAEWRSK